MGEGGGIVITGLSTLHPESKGSAYPHPGSLSVTQHHINKMKHCVTIAITADFTQAKRVLVTGNWQIRQGVGWVTYERHLKGRGLG